MIALLQLRKKEPELERPFKAPLYPWFPVIALVIACTAFLAITIYNLTLAFVYFSLLLIAYIWFRLFYGEQQKTE